VRALSEPVRPGQKSGYHDRDQTGEPNVPDIGIRFNKRPEALHLTGQDLTYVSNGTSLDRSRKE
jgi:hypothetical protein